MGLEGVWCGVVCMLARARARAAGLHAGQAEQSLWPPLVLGVLLRLEPVHVAALTGVVRQQCCP
jgi:hypothetical protein